MGKWRDRTEALRAGNRTRTAQVFTQDGTPSFGLVEDHRSTSAHRNWGGQTDSHRHQRLHRALCCYYTMTTILPVISRVLVAVCIHLLSYETSSNWGFKPNRRIGRKVTFGWAVGRIRMRRLGL
jgi:hypothetical protein